MAILSALLATVIGTAAAEGIYKIRSKFIKASITSITNVPMMNPDIVTGMSMMLFFAAVMAIFKIQDYNEIGFAAMLIAHTTFCLPYVILSVLPRITELGDSLSEAALDLGCTPVQAFLKVKLPNIMSAVLSGAVMAFTLSLDDFVISYFVAPPNFQTLPLLIYSMTKKKVKPDMYALSTIIIVTIFILLLISNFKSENENTDRKKKKVTAVVTSVIAGVAAVAILLSSIMGGGITSGNTETVTLNVYNWGEYMADGSDSEYANVNEMFADYYYAKYGKRVVINYSTYATNEDLFSKLNNSAVSYDIVIPSDYMIEKLIEADLLLEFDVNKDIPNYVYIEDSFKKPYYDPNEKYSVPYTYGMMGIIYNRDMVDEDKLLAESSWGALWDETYAGQILQFNNPRDAFASAMYWKGLDINSTDPAVWDEALDWLIKQKPILQGYVNDEIFDKMTAGSAALAPYFVGDYITMAETEGAADLGFYYPNEGVNYFVDAMCIPKSSKNPEVAKEYINFMLSEEPAIANAEFICYASPNTLVSKNPEYIDYMGEFAYSLLYDKMPEDAPPVTRTLLPRFSPESILSGRTLSLPILPSLGFISYPSRLSQQ